DGTTTSTGTFQVDIDLGNTAPTIVLASTATLTAGQSLSLDGSFTDPDAGDPWQGTVDYDDGTGPHSLTLGADKTSSLSHTEATARTHNGLATDMDGTVASTNTVEVTVNPPNAAPAIAQSPAQSITAGQSLRADGAFTDPDAGDPWQGTVDYGEGADPEELTL